MSDWIAVTDRLPDDDRWVLVAFPEWHDPEFAVSAWMGDQWHGPFIHEPTHWMEIDRP